MENFKTENMVNANSISNNITNSSVGIIYSSPKEATIGDFYQSWYSNEKNLPTNQEFSINNARLSPKEQHLQDFRNSLVQVKLIEEGQIEGLAAESLLDEL